MKIKSLFESKFIKVFDLQYREGRHYYNATRRDEEDLVAAKSTEEFKKMLPDAVSCVVIWNPSGDDEKSGHEPCLLMNREFRYPIGQYLLSVPAGLIDPEDCTGDNDNTAPLIKTAMRELHEETGLKVTEKDTVSVINPCLFSTPGMILFIVVKLPPPSAITKPLLSDICLSPLRPVQWYIPDRCPAARIKYRSFL